MPRATSYSIANLHKVEPPRSKTVVITGASSGIGLSATLALAGAGWRVIVAVRNKGKMEKALSGKNLGPGSVESMQLDLSSFASVKTFAEELLAREDVTKIDSLVLNAGLGTTTWKLTEDKYEYGFQSCYLSHYLLVRLLEQRLIESAPCRVVVVASDVHRGAPKDPYEWPSEGKRGFHSDSDKNFSGPRDYSIDKLANVHFALSLGQRFKDKDITVRALHPGVVNSALWPKWMIGRKYYMLNVDEGAATTTYLTVAPELHDPKDTGSYFAPAWRGMPQRKTPTALGRNEKVAQRLWDETEKIFTQANFL